MQLVAARVSPARVFARPEPGHIWLGPQQRAALEALARPAPLRVLLGPRDCGKTTVLRHWASQRDLVLRCRGPKRDAGEVLAQLLVDAHLTPVGLSEIDQRNLLTVFAQQRRSQGRRVFVAIDDADLFAEPAWREIERLVAWRFQNRPVLDVLLAGSASLLRALRTIGTAGPPPATTVSLAAASRDEIDAYLDWRVARFTLPAQLTAPAKDAIADFARGRYSAVDVLAQMAYLLAADRKSDTVGRALVHEAVATLSAQRSDSGRLPARPTWLQPEKAMPRPLAFVIVNREDSILEHVELRSRTLVGRSEHNDVCLPSPYLSRHHAAIVATAEGYYVVDLNSKNGFAVNGRKTACAMLADGDTIEIGPFGLKFRTHETVEVGGPGRPLADTVQVPAHDPHEPMRRIR